MKNIQNVVSDVVSDVNLGNFQTEIQQNGEFYRIKFSKDGGERFVFVEILLEDGNYCFGSLGRRKGISRLDCERIISSLMDQYD